jgi:hypothetical protein
MELALALEVTAVTTDRVGKLAAELVSRIYAMHKCGSWEKGLPTFDLVAAVDLLLPLLRAGQAMHDRLDECDCEDCKSVLFKWWDALATLEGRE